LVQLFRVRLPRNGDERGTVLLDRRSGDVLLPDHVRWKFRRRRLLRNGRGDRCPDAAARGPELASGGQAPLQVRCRLLGRVSSSPPSPRTWRSSCWRPWSSTRWSSSWSTRSRPSTRSFPHRTL